MKNTENKELELKKQTLIAWTQILFHKEIIDLAKRNRMVELIEKMGK